MPGRRKSDAKREAILGAASAEFASRDFDEVLMEDVATRAGVGKGTLYRYFPTKEELFLATVLRGLSESHDEYLALFAEPAPLAEILERGVTRLLSYFSGREELLTLLQRYEHRLPADEAAAVRERRDAVVDAIAAALAREARSGELRSVDARLAAVMLLGMVRAAVLYRRDARRDAAAVAREIVSLFLDGVRAPNRRGRARLHAVRGGRS